MTSTTLQLTETRKSEPVRLDWSTRRLLAQGFEATLTEADADGTYFVQPGSVIGTATADGCTVTVSPKIEISHVLFLVSYAADPYRWRDDWGAIATARELSEGMAALFVRMCERTLAKGLLRDYRRQESVESVVRGRIRWNVQARRLSPLPIAVRYDVHDDDILENQLVRAAVELLRTQTLHSVDTRLGLERIWRSVRHISAVRDAVALLGQITWTRRNEHYRPLLELMRVILTNSMTSVADGATAVSGFTLSMPEVFERFLRVALRQSMGLTDAVFPDTWSGKALTLDEQRRVQLIPDLAARLDGRWLFVADAKYKVDDSGIGKRDDLYQLLAYAVASGVPEATLVYADGPVSDALMVVNLGVRLRAVHLRLNEPPDSVLTQVKDLAFSLRRSVEPDHEVR